jgi:5,10-methylenetetrahydrofolate reductase
VGERRCEAAVASSAGEVSSLTANRTRDDVPFDLILEIEPPTRPSLVHARHQIGVLGKVADAFLVPDNHLGRATVSSLAVAREVAAMGGRAIACLNSRDRNVLGFRRDLLTAAAYGVGEFLLVYGDRPDVGRRSDDVSVRRMLEEIRTFGATEIFAASPPFRVGVTTRLTPVAPFKADADFLVTQVSHSMDDLARWRDATSYAGPVYAGVMVVASSAMARKLAAETSQLAVPAWLVEAIDRDPQAGLDAACTLLDAIRDHGGFAGVHLVGVGRYRELAARLESTGWARTSRSAAPPSR